MACSRAEPRQDEGYATAAALMVSLAVAILAAALVMRGVAALKLARADFRRSQAEYALSGAQALALAQVLNTAGAGRLAWSMGGLDEASIQVLAEAEAPKLRLEAAGGLDETILARLGAAEPDQARRRLAVLDGQAATPDQIEDADYSPAWRACAASAISPWGAARTLALHPTQAPVRETGGARAGQVWRLRASTHDGWTDERIVRLIGRAKSPGGMIWRRFEKRAGKDLQCGTTLEAPADGRSDPTLATP